MWQTTKHLKKQNRPGLSIGLVLTGLAFMMWVAACSQNGGQMGDNKGERKTRIKENGPDTGATWRRVIVSLNVPGIEEMKHQAAKLKDPAAARAMDRKMADQIAVVADKVLAKVQPAGAELIRRYDTLPLLALRASPQAVSLLESMPDVNAVEADDLNQPMR